ncbi:MAG: ATP synthase F1 subunit gamma [bacterium]|nr:ATP synthase F1 subunit gamma [bacterium]
MASLQIIKKRLKGIGNIHQMTQAMELVAATKMRRAQEVALSSRPYVLTALEILANILEGIEHNGEASFDASRLTLLKKREIKRTAIILVAADKGLAGSFNSAVFKKFERFLAEHPEGDFAYIAVGQKAVDHLKRKGLPIEAQFTRYGDLIHMHDVLPLSVVAREGFESGKWDSVMIHSTHFLSALRQEVISRQILPLDFEKIRAVDEELIPETGRFSELRKQLIQNRPTRPADYLIEPSPYEALETLLPTLFTMQVYHSILEANASEHSARRMAMKSATDSASELIEDLTLEYNRSRQALVTKELIEIAGTTAALKK